MSHTTKLRNGWIAISDGYKLDSNSWISFRRTNAAGVTINIELPYGAIKDFFAEQIGYELESTFEDVDAAGIIDRLIEENRKPKKKNFWEQTHIGEPYEAVGLGENRRDPFPIKATVHFTNEAQYNEFMKWVGD